MLGVGLDGLHQLQWSIITVVFLELEKEVSRRRAGQYSGLSMAYLRDIVEFDDDLINLSVGKTAHQVLVFVVRLLFGGSVLAAALLLPTIIVHEVVLVIEVIFANVDVAKGMGDGLCRGGLEFLEEALEGA